MSIRGAGRNFVVRYALEQIVRFVALMFAVSFVVFALVSASPIDPVQMNVGQAAYMTMSEAKRAQLAQYWGVGTPSLERYANWLASVLQGDWGTSLRFNAPVMEVLGNRAANSLALLGIAWVASGVLGLLLGVVAGVNRDRWPDRLVKGYCFVLAATPTFWLGLVALMVFSVWLGWFPLGFSVPLGKSAADVTLLDTARHIVLPAIVLSFVGVANIALHTREKLVDILESDYVKFARARGLSTWQIVRRHGMRNLLLPAMTLQFASISEIFGGSVLVEQVFSYPGLGQAAITAGLGGDAPLLAGIAVVSAMLVFGGNLTANILYGVVDPRIRRGQMRERAGRPRIARETRDSARAEEALAPMPAMVGAGAGQVPSAGALPSVRRSVAQASSAVRESLQLGTLLHAPRRRGANRVATFAKFVVAAILLVFVVIAGMALSDAATTTDFSLKSLAPCLAHPFGTDWMGRDMFARTLSGLSTSVVLGLVAACVSSVIAVILGAAAALCGPKVDAVVSWLIDLMMGVPHIVLLVLISYALGKGFWGVAVGVAITHWPNLARVVRAEILQCKQSDFVMAARRMGKSSAYIAIHHMVPFVLPQFVVGLVLMFPHAILHEASITFLGFGLPPEMPAIGVILSESMGYLTTGMWWLAVFPGVALVAAVMLFDAAGESLRKLVDPHTSQE